MAIETDIIKQYLISFGYQIDKTGERELNSLSASAESLGGNVVAAGLKVAGLVDKVSAMGMGLNSLAQDARDNTADFRAYTRAFEQIGVNAKLAQATIATMGNEAQHSSTMTFLKGLHLEGMSSVQVFDTILDKYKQIQDTRGNVPQQVINDQFEAMYLKPLGVQSDVFLKAYKNYDTFKQGVSEYQQIQQGVGIDAKTFDDLTESQKKFREESFALESELIKLTTVVLPVVNSALDAIIAGIPDLNRGVDVFLNDPATFFKILGQSVVDTAKWDANQVGEMMQDAKFQAMEWSRKSTIADLVASGKPVPADLQHPKYIKDYEAYVAGRNADRPSPMMPNAPRPVHVEYPMRAQVAVPVSPSNTPQAYDARVAERITQTLMSALQLTRKQASALVGGFAYESQGLNPRAKGDNNTSFGLAQWHADRIDLFRRVMGVDVRQASVDDQIKFIVYELRNNKSATLQALRAARTDAEMAQAAFSSYEVGKPAQANMAQRMRNMQDIYRQAPSASPLPAIAPVTPQAQPFYGPGNSLLQTKPLGSDSASIAKPNVTISQSNTFDIKSTGADPKQIANSVGLMQERANRDLYRDFRSEFA